MTKNKNFAAALVDDYTDSLNFADRVNEHSMRSFDGETTLELDSIENGNEVVGLQIFSNGLSVFEGDYDDADFSEEVARVIVSNLNV